MKLEVFADGNENLNCYLAKPFSDRHGFAKSRSCCQGVLYDDKMYFYGGTPHPNGNDFYSDIVQYIDLKTINYELGEMEIHEVTITQPGIKPEGRIFHSLICDDESTNGKPASMIVYGGFTDGRRLLNNCFSFQFENKIWKKNSNGPCLEGHTAIFRKKNRTMIVFGGHMGSYKHFENSTYEYDIVKDIWTKLNIDNSSIVSPLAYHRAVYVEELDWMVVHGGKTKPGRTAILSSNVYILNFATMRWHVLNQEPMAFDNSSNSSVLPSSNLTLPKIMAQQSICVDSSIIFFGGETEDSDVPSQQLFVINLETLEIIEYCPYQHEPGLLQRKYVDKSYTEPEATVIPPLYDSCCIYDHTSSNIFAYGGRLYSLEIPFMVAVHVSETNCTENSLFDYWKNNINSQTLTSYLQAYFNDSQVSEHSFYDEVSHTSHNVHHLVLEKYPNILTSNIEKRLLKLLLKFLHGYNIIFEIESGKELVSLLESSRSIGLDDTLTEWSLPYLQRLLLHDSSLDFSAGATSTIPQVETLIKDIQNQTVSQFYKVKHIHYFVHKFFKERRERVAMNLVGDFRLKIKGFERDVFRVDKSLLLTCDFFKTIIETPLRAEIDSSNDEIILEPLAQHSLTPKILNCILDHIYGIEFEYSSECWPLEDLLSLYVYSDFYCIPYLARTLNKIIFDLIDELNAKLIFEQIGPLSEDIAHRCSSFLTCEELLSTSPQQQ